MSSLLKTSMKRAVAESFLSDLSTNKNNYFFFIAKSTNWSDENFPPAYVDSIRNEYDVMNNIIAYKKIDGSSVMFAVPKYLWTTGTVYDKYTDSEDMFDEVSPSKFYVVTSQNHIFKCLGNNNGGVSTVVPETVQVFRFKLSDGYIWKYIGTVIETNLPIELSEYLVVNFIVDKTNTDTQTQYLAQFQSIPGEITSIVPYNTTNTPVYSRTIQKPQSGASVFSLKVFSFTNSNGVKTIRITDPSSLQRIIETGTNGFTSYALRVDYSDINTNEIGNYGIITSEVITAQYAEFVIADDIYPFRVTVGGQEQQYPPIVSVEIIPFAKIYGNGVGGLISPIMSSEKRIVSFDVTSSGKDYTSIFSSVVSPPGAGVTLAHPDIQFILSPKEGHSGNILKELNVKDLVIFSKINKEDSIKFMNKGSYRMFGIIKNPVLSSSQRIAGSDVRAYKDISVIYEGNSTNLNNVVSELVKDSNTLMIGKETYSVTQIDKIKSVNDTTKEVVFRTLDSFSAYRDYQSHKNNFILQVLDNSSFAVGEKITQRIPANTLFAGVSFGYEIITTGIIVEKPNINDLLVLTTNNYFVIGQPIEGEISFYSSSVLQVKPSYGEGLYFTDTIQFKEDGNFKVYDVGSSYFELSNTSMYSGLHSFHISTSISGQTGGIDVTSVSLTPASFSEGDIIIQGSTGSYSAEYGKGVVYEWDFINSSHGILRMTDVFGKFTSVESDGITLGKLGNFQLGKIEYPEILQTSGEVLYIDSMRKIQRIPGQEEEFRVLLQF